MLQSSIPAVIFAGGKSSRMGTDKSLLPLGEYSSLGEFLYRKLQNIFRDVYITTKKDKFGFQAPLIFDRYEASSPLVAIVSTFEAIKEDAFFAIGVDTPLISPDDIKRVIAFAEQNSSLDAIIAMSNKKIEPLVGIYRRSILPLAKDLLKKDDHRLTSLIKKSTHLFVDFKDEWSFINLNHIDDYHKALKLL